MDSRDSLYLYGNGRFLRAYYTTGSNTVIGTSLDGITWNDATIVTGIHTTLGYGKDVGLPRYLAGGFYSDDGIIWKPAQSSIQTAAKIIYG